MFQFQNFKAHFKAMNVTHKLGDKAVLNEANAGATPHLVLSNRVRLQFPSSPATVVCWGQLLRKQTPLGTLCAPHQLRTPSPWHLLQNKS